MKFLVVYDYETEEDGELVIIEIEEIVEAESEDDIPEPFHHWIKFVTPYIGV
ncbi:MAG: hypothetical protein H6Q35_408 [Proteobacteria bacterium]|nr:hypothetical protein [Pseudomonadota bacterium]